MSISVSGNTVPAAYGTAFPASAPALESGSAAHAFAAHRPEGTPAPATQPDRCAWLRRVDKRYDRQLAAAQSAADLRLSAATAREAIEPMEGVDEYIRVLASWVSDGTYGCEEVSALLKKGVFRQEDEPMLDRVVEAWRQNGVFKGLMNRVMARYERDGTLAAAVDGILLEDPSKSRAAAQQEARTLLRSWEGDTKAKNDKFDLLLYPDGDLGSEPGNATAPDAMPVPDGPAHRV